MAWRSYHSTQGTPETARQGVSRHKMLHRGTFILQPLARWLESSIPQWIHPITQEMKMDVFWLVAFLQQFNGVHFIRQPTIQQTLYVDSCLTAGGAAWGTAMFTAVYPPSLVACQWHISQLEAFTLLLALRFWQSQLARQNIRIFCDNTATVAVMQSGRSVDPFLLACAREVWLLATLNDISLTTTHIAGVLNQTADTLSQAHLSHSAAMALHDLETGCSLRLFHCQTSLWAHQLSYNYDRHA